MKRDYRINPENETSSIRVLLDRIERGYKLQNEEFPLGEQQILDYNGSIILAPDYQREYRFTLEDEIKLVESVLIGIPIPPIFLATDKFNEARITNVVDGQHRLRALHRFYNNQFALSNLSLFEGLEGCFFKNLDLELRSEFLEKTLLTTIFKDFPGKDFELEIFNRYNKGTKPLSSQEIRHAVYNSQLNLYVNSFTTKLYEEKKKNTLTDTFLLKNVYNVTKDRIQKKKLQEGLFVVMSILEEGIDLKYEKSSDYAENYMKKKSLLEEKNSDEAKQNFEKLIKLFDEFNNFILRLREKCDYPFSKEIYGISSRNYKFQISIAMIIAGVFNKIYKNELMLEKIMNDDDFRSEFLETLKVFLLESFIEDPEYKGSSTNSKEIYNFVEKVSNEINIALDIHDFKNTKQAIK